LPPTRRPALDESQRLNPRRVARGQPHTEGGARERLIAALGHELRNPLAAMNAALELMKLRGGGMLERERAVLERQAGRLVRLVEDFFNTARFSPARVALRRTVAEVSSAVVKGAELAGDVIKRQRQQVCFAFPDAGLPVYADQARLARAFFHLLTNVAKCGRGAGLIEIAGARDGDEVVVSVTDDGAGIAPHVLARIFEPFAPGARALDRAAGGIGLGLNIARGIVGLHGGAISARSDGSQFVVRLPVAIKQVSAPRGPCEARGDQDQRAAQSKRLLVVDDNRDAAETLREVLQAYGYVTQVAYDGPSGLEAAKSFRPDVALVDIGLPAMDGYEVARRIRQLPELRAIRLIAVTGYGQASDRQRSAQAGFDCHLVKPVDLAELRRSINA
jgi:CheY-like chemotaxis protein